MTDSLMTTGLLHTTIYVFQKSPRTIGFIKSTEMSPVAKIATEIVAASLDMEVAGDDFWGYLQHDEDLKPILMWHEISKTRYYSVVLNPRLSDFWKYTAYPYIAGNSPLIDSKTLTQLSQYLDAVAEFVEEKMEKTFLEFVNVDISGHLNDTIDEIVEDCRLNSSEIYTNAFNLKTYH
ncbi:MAG: hypothetical protein EBY22_10775 [Gammaproteobacteria bacterium]|nr:hypothetical protein [Gammaproteobacteria bacterium]